jgi:hypothetical protein
VKISSDVTIRAIPGPDPVEWITHFARGRIIIYKFCRPVKTFAIFVTAKQITKYMRKFIGVAINNSLPIGPPPCTPCPTAIKTTAASKMPGSPINAICLQMSSLIRVLSPCTDTRLTR